MTIIKKIINWLKNLFSKLFGKKKKNKKKINNQIISNKNKKKVASINSWFDGSLPSYMLISDKEKDILLYSLSIMKSIVVENYTKLIEKEKAELVKVIKLNNNEILDIDKKLDNKYLSSLTQGFSDIEKQKVYNHYLTIENYDKELKNSLFNIDKTIDLIKNTDISFIAEKEIMREMNNITTDKNVEKINDKIDIFNKKATMISMNIDEDFLSIVLSKYNKINFITISTTIIDQDYEILKKLEDDFKKHRFNKAYYERETNSIKKEINRIKELRNNKDIYNQILLLRKELYTKSKDKYDLLYNDEVFLNLEKECDILLDKINAKVVDIKKEKEIKKDNKLDKYIENILLRFHDMELARKIILACSSEDIELNNEEDIINLINNMCTRFYLGIDENFNFARNKTKTELVIYYNDLNRLINKLNNKPYISIEHINFKMEDLIEATKIKKEELSAVLDNKKIRQFDYTEVDEKISLLEQKLVNNNSHVLKKSVNERYRKDDK